MLELDSTIGVIGDIEASARGLEEGIKRVRRGNRSVNHFIQLGDFGHAYTSFFLASVDRFLEEHEATCYFIDGNHDAHPYLWELPEMEDGTRKLNDRCFYLPRGFRFMVGESTALAFGGATSVDQVFRQQTGMPWWPTEEISDEDMKRAGDDSVDILFSHDFPRGSNPPLPGLDIPSHIQEMADASSQKVRTIVERTEPRINFHGHTHVRYSSSIPETGTQVEGLAMGYQYGSSVVYDETRGTIQKVF